MPLLIELLVTHHAAKSSKTATAAWLIADGPDASARYIDVVYLHGELSAAYSDRAGECCPTAEWWQDHPEKKAEAIAAGLTIGEFGDVLGPGRALSLWWGGTTWQEIDADVAYYGVSQYDWSRCREIDDADAAVLLRLGVAVDIRRHPDSR